MNSDLELLYKIAQKPFRTIIGLMSGTSLDGLDVALCAISGSGENTEVQLLHFDTVDYSEDIKLEIRNVFAKQTIDFQKLVLTRQIDPFRQSGCRKDPHLVRFRSRFPAETRIEPSHPPLWQIV